MKNQMFTDCPTYEFHVAKKIRDKYELDESFFSSSGNVVFANFYQVRLFVQKVNDKRDVANHVSPGEINGAGLLDEIYHVALNNYVRQVFPNAFANAIEQLREKLGAKNLDRLLLNFVEQFPPISVVKKKKSPQKYLLGSSNGISNKEILLEELILLYIENRNPALNKIKEFFDESYLQEKEVYNGTLSVLKSFFKREDLKIGLTNTDLFDFLSKPFQNYSDSIWDQLEYIKNEWGIFIDATLFRKIESSKDLFIESIIVETPHFGGKPPTIAPKYKREQIGDEGLVIGKSNYDYIKDSAKDYEEYEHFTPDVNWMPNLVLIAKNIYVWLDQLSKKYGKEIKTLDKIPLEELKELRKSNINGLWLIGIWERSSASKKIKHIMGNIDAVASAYSLFDYHIARDLGGDEAYEIFNKNAKQAGIRLASDMVPNHTGIYSQWIIDHPEYFIQSEHPPFPTYSFTGENLSEHPEIEIRIEDKYWEMSDAAVVFERYDKRNGDRKYIYHGNDGTSMPWNDTAQLDMLKHEVREAVIQKIFDVARKFSVIRFDAAMTLAKKHFSRLWYPEPGKGGDIPSRADYAMTKDEFDRLFPKEFWREVVDRINEEMPETLLLAEAFWLMEGYFVRTLGMHRVYNSAFMNMMMNEENSKYRELITNTLEFEPEILKRYVNFMSNPDEETAIAQFGDGDKYFGVLVLMCTLPGLPMFAHGQIEGYKEKYGMEYQRAYYDESPNEWLVERHKREIFPILKKRYIFSEVNNFWLFDFLGDSDQVNENVFVYFNESNNEKALVVYNNKFEQGSGYFKFSRQKLIGNSSNSNHLENRTIAELLGITNNDFDFCILKDAISGLEYIFNTRDIHNNGLYFNLSGYEHKVFLNVEVFSDTTGDVYKFYKENYGKGFFDVRDHINKIKLEPIFNNFEKIVDNDFVEELTGLINQKLSDRRTLSNLETNYNNNVHRFINSINESTDFNIEVDKFIENNSKSISILVNSYKDIRLKLAKDKPILSKEINELLKSNLEKGLDLFLVFNSINILAYNEKGTLAANLYVKLYLDYSVKKVLSKFYSNDKVSLLEPLLVMTLRYLFNGEINLEELYEKLKARSAKKIISNLKKEYLKEIKFLFKSDLLKYLIGCNNYKGVEYYNKEQFEMVVKILFNLFSSIIITGKTDKNLTRAKSRDLKIKLIKKLFLLRKYLISESRSTNYVYPQLRKIII